MKFYKKIDLIIIGILLVLAGIIWTTYRVGFTDKPAKAEIYYMSELVMTVELDTKEEKQFTIPQNDHVVIHLYSDGSIAFEKSDCPDKVCVHTGKINRVGETAACLPNKILIKIVSYDRKDSDEPDIVVGR